MSDFYRPPGDSGSEGAFERQGQQQANPQYPQQPVNPDTALLQGAMQDPYLSQYLANQVRQNMMGGAQQQQAPAPVNPADTIRTEMEQIQSDINKLRDPSIPEEQRDYIRIMQLEGLYRDKRVEVVDLENRQRYEQFDAQNREREANQLFGQFMIQRLSALPLNDAQRYQLTQEFTVVLQSAWSRDVLSNPQQLQQILPDQWKAFAYDKNLPRQGQPQQGQQGQGYQQQGYQQPGQAPARYGEQYNGTAPAQPQQPTDPNDPLGRLADMNNYERAMMKAQYTSMGKYDIADKITNTDGSPIMDRSKI